MTNMLMLQVHHAGWAQDNTFQIEVKIVAEKKEIVAKMKEMQRLWRKRRLWW